MAKRRAVIAVSLVFALSGTVSAQVVEEWLRQVDGTASDDDKARAIVVDGSGNIIVTGYSTRDATHFDRPDYTTVKYSPDGTLLFRADLEGLAGGNLDDRANAVAVDAAGNVFVTGVSDTFPSDTMVTVKYNSSLVEQWRDTRTGSGNAIAVDAAGDVYVTGHNGSFDYLTVKLSGATGAEVWSATMDRGTDDAVDLVVDPTGFVYVTGTSHVATHDLVTVKYQNTGVDAGDEVWSKTFDLSTAGNLFDEKAVGLGIDGLGNVFVGGTRFALTVPADQSYLLVKYDSAGNELWDRKHDGNQTVPLSRDQLADIEVDAAGNAYLTGRVENMQPEWRDLGTVKFDTDGNKVWSDSFEYGNSDFGRALTLDASGNVYVTGDGAPLAGGQHYVTVKYDSAGTVLWDIATVESFSLFSADVAVDANGTTYVTGYGNVGPFAGDNDFVTTKYGPPELDFGDAPDTYATLVASNGARHVITGSTLHLGAGVDMDADGQPSVLADGDDLDAGGDDEDGVTFDDPLVPDTDASLTVVASDAGFLDAWIDWNQDGIWGAGEQVLTNQAVIAGANGLLVSVPVSAAAGETFARFRLSSAGSLSHTDSADDGEVEDYRVVVGEPPTADAGDDYLEGSANGPVEVGNGFVALGGSPTGSGGSGSYTYSWAISPGAEGVDWSLSDTSAANPTFSGLETGTYFATVTVTDTTNTLNDEDTLEIDVVVAETLTLDGETFSGPVVVEATQQITLSNTTIEAGANVVLRAPQVELGANVTVEDGATLTIEHPHPDID